MSIIRDIRHARARGQKMRPWWQILILLPTYPLYWLARQFVNLYEAMMETL